MLDQIDFHGMTAEELSGENGLLKQLTIRFLFKSLRSRNGFTFRLQKK